MEATWLGALIVIPIFFNIYSSRIFEPDKTAILRSLALVGLGILVINKLSETNIGDTHPNVKEPIFSRAKMFMARPMMLPVAAIAVSYLVATLFSVIPQTSLWGSYQRLQGVYTIFSYMVIFYCVYFGIRTRAQLERLLTTAIITSFPISLYGIAQRYGLDSIPWAGNVTDRIAANMGNSIFVAAFLIMVMPLTLVRVVDCFRRGKTNGKVDTGKLTEGGGYSLIAISQIMAVYFSGSRGPWLGAAAGFIVLFLGITFVWGKKWLLVSGSLMVGLIMIVIIVMNIPGGPLEDLRSLPRIGRLGQLLDVDSRTGRVRTLIWEGASQLFLPHDALGFPDGSLDRYNLIRPIVGYGPESMFVAFNRFYPPGLTEVEKRNASPDRSHNEVWDVLIFNGVLGFGAFFLLYGSIAFYALNWSGFIRTKHHKSLFWVCLLLGAVLVTTLVVIWRDWSYFAIGFPGGLLLGLIVFMYIRNLNQENQIDDQSEQYRKLVLLGVFAGIVAHYLELVFGFGITTTRLYFWVFVAALVIIGSVLHKKQFSSDKETVFAVELGLALGQPVNKSIRGGKPEAYLKQGKKNRSRNQNKQSGFEENLRSYSPGFISAILMCTLIYDFPGVRRSFVTFSNLSQSAEGAKQLALLIMCLLSWLIPTYLLIKGSFDENSFSGGKISHLLINFLIPVFTASIYLVYLTGTLNRLANNLPTSIQEVMNQVRGYETVFITFFALLLILIAALGASLTRNNTQKDLQSARIGLIISPLVVGIVVAGIVFGNIRVVQADISFKSASSFSSPENLPVAVEIYKRAIFLAPSEDHYYLFLVKAYFDQTSSTQDSETKINLVRTAEADMLKAIEINPLNTDHTANLARLYTYWTGFVESDEERARLAQKALDHYQTAVSLSPYNSRLLGEMALLYLNQLADPEESISILERALDIDPGYDWLLGIYGETLFRIAESSPENSQKRLESYRLSLDAFMRSYIQTNPADQQSLYRTSLSIARTNSRLGRLKQAVEYYEKALIHNPETPDAWRIYELLANLSLQDKNIRRALAYAQLGLNSAPEDQRHRFESLIEFLADSP